VKNPQVLTSWPLRAPNPIWNSRHKWGTQLPEKLCTVSSMNALWILHEFSSLTALI
jgi:hypothetical protein